MSRYMRYSSISPPLFDCNQAQCFFVAMSNNVSTARIRNIGPGVLYTFIIQQDSTGGHVFLWPAECLNAIPIDPTPGAVTVVNFIGLAGNQMQSTAAGTYTA